MTKHTPATPLPWNVAGGSLDILKSGGKRMHAECRGAGSAYGESSDDANAKNAAYIAHAANAYPRLVEALRKLTDDGRTMFQENVALDRARALLRELGEDK